MRTRCYCFWITIVVLLAWLEPVAAQAEPTQSPGTNTAGLVWDGTKFWASDRQTETLYFYDANGVWQAAMTWNGSPGPLAWDGEQLWVVDESAKLLVRVKIDDAGPTRTAEIQIPAAALREVLSITGLTWDGNTLWLSTACGLCSNVYRIDPTTGDVLQSFFPRCAPRGLAYRYGSLWTTAYSGPDKTALLSEFDITNPPSSVSTSQQFQRFCSNDSCEPEDPTAIAINNDGFWVVDRATGEIWKVDPRGI
ncbi:MAG: hypothetical protein GY906_09180 [bacterium]|nr:hypothetical protein [bacterium]